jgi:hypothetical protein
MRRCHDVRSQVTNHVAYDVHLISSVVHVSDLPSWTQAQQAQGPILPAHGPVAHPIGNALSPDLVPRRNKLTTTTQLELEEEEPMMEA